MVAYEHIDNPKREIRIHITPFICSYSNEVVIIHSLKHSWPLCIENFKPSEHTSFHHGKQKNGARKSTWKIFASTSSFPLPLCSVILCHGSVRPIYHMQLPTEQVKFKPCCVLFCSVIFCAPNNIKTLFQMKLQRSQDTSNKEDSHYDRTFCCSGNNLSLSCYYIVVVAWGNQWTDCQAQSHAKACNRPTDPLEDSMLMWRLASPPHDKNMNECAVPGDQDSVPVWNQ